MGEYGFKKLIVWQTAKILRRLVYEVTAPFPKLEMRRVSQMRDSARSVKQNIQEGYMSGSTGSYIRFLKISRSSLAELSGDVDDCLEDKLVTQDAFGEINSLMERTEYLLKRLIQSLQRKLEAQKRRKNKGQK